MIQKFTSFSRSFLTAMFFLQIIYAQETSRQITALEINKTLTTAITGGAGEKQIFQFQLGADQYAKITIEQTDVDVSAEIYGAQGNFLSKFDNELRLKQNEILEIVAPGAGNCRIEIKTLSKNWSGKYKITLNEIRQANDRDRALSEARTLAAKAAELLSEDKIADSLIAFNRALEISEKQSEPPAFLISRILNGLIEANNAKGDYAAAESLIERALAFNTKNFGTDHPLAAQTVFLRGGNYRTRGDRAAADRFFRQSLTMFETILGKDHPMLFDPLLKLSGLYISQDDLDGAVAYLKRAEKIVEINYGADHKMMAGVVNNLGVVYMSKNEDDTAEKYYLRVLDIGEKANEINQYRYSLTTQNLAIIYARKKDVARSLEFYERTLKIREKVLGGGHLQVGWALYGMSGAYIAMGNREKALEALRRTREIAEKSVGYYHSLTTAAMRRTAKILAAQGKTQEAVALQKLHDERYEKFFASEMNIGSERQKLLSVKKLDYLTSDTISLQLSAAPNNRTASDIAALAVLQRKGRVFDAVADNLAAIRQRAGETDRLLFDRFNNANSEIANLTLNKPAKMTTAEYEKQIAELEQLKEKTEVEIGDRNAQFAVQNPSVSLDAIKAEIPADAALVEFAVYLPLDLSKNQDDIYGEPRYIAYILRKTGEVKYTELGDKKTIDKTIDDLRKALRDAKRKDVKQFARSADEKIMKPVRALLGDARQIFVSPDGDLNLIPFESLIDEKGNYLIENYAFNYLTSGRDFLRMKTARASKSEISIIANPSFSASNDAEQVEKIIVKTAPRDLSGTYFAPLAGTLTEARSIQNIFPAARLLTEKLATETALKEINAPRILHIATHGFFLENTAELNVETNRQSRTAAVEAETTNPLLRSGIALAGANKRGEKAADDGILTALEAAGLNLWGTKLVVLSACDTGIGDVKNGEGVYGLRRAFTLAGTESLVMSLWAVSDYATRELMTNYYKNLKNGMGRGESLRQIKIEMLKKKDREHPFYWAGFIQSGEWANLEGKR